MNLSLAQAKDLIPDLFKGSTQLAGITREKVLTFWLPGAKVRRTRVVGDSLEKVVATFQACSGWYCQQLTHPKGVDPNPMSPAGVSAHGIGNDLNQVPSGVIHVSNSRSCCDWTVAANQRTVDQVELSRES